jgi:hypothetical protein
VPAATGSTRSGPARIAATAVLVLMLGGCGSSDAGGDGPSPQGAAGAGSLLVSGRIAQDGLAVEPAFQIDAPPTVPAGDAGRHRLVGRDAAGATVFEIRFDGVEVADLEGGEEHFTFAVPLGAGDAERLHTIALEAGDGRSTSRTASYTAAQLAAALQPEDAITAERQPDGSVRVRWDAQRFPMVIVREPDTRRILTFARAGEAVVIHTGARIEVVVSDGVRSGAKVVEIR